MLIPEDAKRIGILLSGGMDSSILLYLLCKEVHENQKSVIINACHMKPRTDLTVIVQSVMDYTSSKFPVTISYHTMPRRFIREGVRNILDVLKCDYVFTGCNKVVVGEFTPTKIIIGDTPPVRGEPYNERHLRPFIHMDKREIVELYINENVLDMIPLTVSCGVYDMGDAEKDCGECYFCMEKRWGMQFYNL